MKIGKILAYSAVVSAGIILCGGHKYQFTKADWLSLPGKLANDQDVSFKGHDGHSGQSGRASQISAT